MYGVVFFDDPQRPLGGWASIAGHAARRIRGAIDLPPEVQWWSNLAPEAFMASSIEEGLTLKGAEYLRPSMMQLHSELGLRPEGAAVARVTEITGEIFDRVMRLGHQHYGLQKLAEHALTDDLYRLVVSPDQPITPEIDAALQKAHMSYVACDTVMLPDTRLVTFRRPRLQHALDVLATPVPGDHWEFLDDAKLPPESNRIDWLVAQSRPALVKVTIRRIDHDVAPIISIGDGTREQRSWLSHPELLTLSKFARIKVDAAYLASEYAPHPVRLAFKTAGELGPLSLSMGILAENYWMALASPRSFRRFSREGDKVVSPRAAWYAASDRFHMLMPALMMHGSGFTVRGYGRGMVLLALREEAVAEARACGAAAGLLPPLKSAEIAPSPVQ